MAPAPRPAHERETSLLEASDLLVAKRRRHDGTTTSRTWVGDRRKSTNVGWTWADLLFLGTLNLIVLANGMDLVLTLVHISNVGWAAEGNPFARMVGESAGPLVFTLVKVLAVGVTIPVQWYLYRQVKYALATARSPRESVPAQMSLRVMFLGTGFLFALYFWVVQNNVRVIGLLDTLVTLLP
ncbi:MAG: hypothetical protein KY455_07120 [Euryarchaeota archaeon]|nr:hypothetical protein [Euryarchaeota archaeon]